MDSAAKTLALAAALVVVAVACGTPTDTSSGGLGERLHPARRIIALGAGHRGATGADSSHSSTSHADEESTTGDKKTFAYASTDGAAIATEVTSVLAPAAGGGTVHYEGYELLDDAQRLESMAGDATARLKNVKPSNRALVDARRDGISAYSLTADYATLMINLAQADANDDLGALNAAANQALALEGRGQELADLYTALITELEAWSRSHPEAAAEALKEYGG
jgi:hypothetical protein